METLNKIDNLSFSNCCRCILKNIGATVMGVKPAELRNIRLHDPKNRSWWKKCKMAILAYDEIGIVEIKEVKKSKKVFLKVLFYHKSALDKQLREKNNLKYLKEFGYPKEYNINSYLRHLKNKFKDDNFPHEIGIFFGYPIKDVLGFMGYIDLEETYTKEWRFYGNKNISLLRQRKFDLAREYFNNSLDNLKNVKEFYRAI